MCDDFTEKDNSEFLRRNGLTRRDFGKGGAGVALSMMLPTVAMAGGLSESDVLVETPDGNADCYFVHPREGAHAGVIIWPDIMGIRESFRMMGKRLAGSGYATLVVNPYYRSVKGPVIESGENFGQPAVRERLLPLAKTLSPETCVTDGRAFVEFLDAQPSVDSARQMGTTGYCMTGPYTIRLAAAMPERIGAGASFHGGDLATLSTDSPHLLVDHMDAGFLIAIAANDHRKDPNVKLLLRDAFDEAGLDAEIEVYDDTLHGWCPPDSPVYHEAQAERAWSRLLALLDRELA